MNTSVLLFVVGMGFGTSYSLVHVDCLDWVHTKLWHRLARAIIGTLIVTGFYIACLQIPGDNNATIFMFRYALPNFCISFFIYGIYPILCMRMGLVKDSSSTKSVSSFSSSSSFSMESDKIKTKGMITKLRDDTIDHKRE